MFVFPAFMITWGAFLFCYHSAACFILEISLVHILSCSITKNRKVSKLIWILFVETPLSSFGNVAASSILKLRATVATALGAAAANAKLLADQEEREIEHLFAIMLEAQVFDLTYFFLHKLCQVIFLFYCWY